MSLAEELRTLELSMLSPAGRYSEAALGRLLSEDFREFGGSGVIYDRAGLIAALIEEGAGDFAPIDVSDFAVRELGAGVALVTYRSMRAGQARLRSSVWRQAGGAWRIVFHQATPAST